MKKLLTFLFVFGLTACGGGGGSSSGGPSYSDGTYTGTATTTLTVGGLSSTITGTVIFTVSGTTITADPTNVGTGSGTISGGAFSIVISAVEIGCTSGTYTFSGTINGTAITGGIVTSSGMICGGFASAIDGTWSASFSSARAGNGFLEAAKEAIGG